MLVHGETQSAWTWGTWRCSQGAFASAADHMRWALSQRTAAPGPTLDQSSFPVRLLHHPPLAFRKCCGGTPCPLATSMATVERPTHCLKDLRRSCRVSRTWTSYSGLFEDPLDPKCVSTRSGGSCSVGVPRGIASGLAQLSKKASQKNRAWKMVTGQGWRPCVCVRVRFSDFKFQAIAKPESTPQMVLRSTYFPDEMDPFGALPPIFRNSYTHMIGFIYLYLPLYIIICHYIPQLFVVKSLLSIVRFLRHTHFITS